MSEIILLSLPIGNLGDLTRRVQDALNGPGLFVVEDTRSFRSLLTHLGCSFEGKEILSYHDQSSRVSCEYVLGKILERGKAYLCSEAGSPVISDPAYPLLKLARLQGVKISSMPGPSSVVMALELSTFPAHPFTYHGFLARGREERKKFFESLSTFDGMTHIFFEAPQRVRETLQIAIAALPRVRFCACREMTKLYESVYFFEGQTNLSQVDELPEKGEYVCLAYVEHSDQTIPRDAELTRLAGEVLESKGHKKSLAKLLSKILCTPTKQIYQELSGSNL
ncbi:MAG: hypothetical protein A2X86_19915 [Bdellovibrionales bacterium GWA2_49_15]|nr:MAG: hypothetical protein A2X86_19915 [Bdellovibrionales bacterium GWA2_49_15]